MIGNVYVVRTVLSNPPKDKITICVCTADNLFLWINTEARQRDGQMLLTAADHSSLDRDCYLDCSRLTMFTAADLSGARDRGPITPDLAERIVEFLKVSPPRTLPGNQLNLIIANLSSLI